jgi:hypothetical protein
MTGKFVLIEHGDAGQPHTIRLFSSQSNLELATMLAIFGEELKPETSSLYQEPTHWEEWLGYLEKLREDGSLSFEGDPGLEWMRANILDGEHGPERTIK